MRESSIEGALVRYAKQLGIYTRKFTSPSQRGVPDRIFVKFGCVLFLEIKAPGKKPTPLQVHELELLKKQDANVAWTDNVEDGKAMLKLMADEWMPDFNPHPINEHLKLRF